MQMVHFGIPVRSTQEYLHAALELVWEYKYMYMIAMREKEAKDRKIAQIETINVQ